MAQRGAWLGLVVGLAVGCADSERAPDSMEDDRDAAVDGGGSGAGGDAQGDGGLLACVDTLPAQIGVCVAPVEPVTGPVDSFTGVVQAVGQPEQGCSIDDIGDVSPGDPHGYAVVISDGDTTVSVNVYLPFTSAFTNVGDMVTLEHHLESYIEAPSQGRLTVRGADGELLLWAVMTSRGFDGLAMPELAVRSGEATCEREEVSCGTVTQGGIVARSGDSGDVEIGWGEQADVGEFVVLHGDNTTRPRSCLGSVGQFVVFAAVREARAAQRSCSELSDRECGQGDGCQTVYAHRPGENPSMFITCVADESCGDGDAETCAVDDESGELIMFTTTCVPPGWTRANYDACDEDTDGGAP